MATNIPTIDPPETKATYDDSDSSFSSLDSTDSEILLQTFVSIRREHSSIIRNIRYVRVTVSVYT